MYLHPYQIYLKKRYSQPFYRIFTIHNLFFLWPNFESVYVMLVIGRLGK